MLLGRCRVRIWTTLLHDINNWRRGYALALRKVQAQYLLTKVVLHLKGWLSLLYKVIDKGPWHVLSFAVDLSLEIGITSLFINRFKYKQSYQAEINISIIAAIQMDNIVIVHIELHTLFCNCIAYMHFNC